MGCKRVFIHCMSVCLPACLQDITKLIQLDTDLADVVAALRGGLTAQFVHHMISRKISFVVSKEPMWAEGS